MISLKFFHITLLSSEIGKIPDHLSNEVTFEVEVIKSIEILRH